LFVITTVLPDMGAGLLHTTSPLPLLAVLALAIALFLVEPGGSMEAYAGMPRRGPPPSI
jgi:hypothetical protein